MVNSNDSNSALNKVLASETGQFPSDSVPAYTLEQSPSEMFFELTDYLREQFAINKGVLVVKRDNAKLSAISMWNNGFRQDGLTLNLPKKESLFEKVLESGCLHAEFIRGTFDGNFFERKLLLDDHTLSFALKPLILDGKVIGLIGFSSEKLTSFTQLDEGESVELLDDFAEKLHRGKTTV